MLLVKLYSLNSSDRGTVAYEKEGEMGCQNISCHIAELG
jgi:hypothetical protein